MDDDAAPRGLEVHRTPEVLRVRRRWFSPQYVAVAVLAAFIAGWSWIEWKAAPHHGTSLMLAAIAGFGVYAFLVGLVNSTRIELSTDELVVSHGPLPPRRTRVLPLARVGLLGVRQRRFGGATYTSRSLWELVAADATGAELWVMPGFESQDQADWMKEHVLELTRLSARRAQRPSA